MKNSILLFAGVILTLLFVIFPSQIFEVGFYDREFSNAMYNENLYFVVALVTAIVAWLFAALFYYVVNSVRFSRWYHWLITLGVASILSAIINFIYPNSIFSDMGYDFDSQMFSFSVIDFVMTALLFTIASFSIRWWSSNCRHTPIPE